MSVRIRHLGCAAPLFVPVLVDHKKAAWFVSGQPYGQVGDRNLSWLDQQSIHLATGLEPPPFPHPEQERALSAGFVVRTCINPAQASIVHRVARGGGCRE